MRILAIDYGSARIGCAVSDPSGTLSTPLPAIVPADLESVVELCGRTAAEVIVVGLPRNLSGKEGHQAVETRKFCDRLADAVEVPVETFDERFTTRMAAATRRETGARADEDSIAAAHLLDDYLTSRLGPQRGGAESG